ncbi:hypothetical protein MY8738_010212, partial [Beauveria namnaoensis]
MEMTDNSADIPAEVIHPRPATHPALVASASGTYSTLNDQRTVLDACGVSMIGHGDETV